MQLTAIVAVVDHLARNNQLVPIVHGDLHVIARNHSARSSTAAGRRDRCATIASRRYPPASPDPALAFARFSKSAASFSAMSSPDRSSGNVDSCRVVSIQRRAVGLDIAFHRRELLRQPLAGDDARLARVAVEERAVNRYQLAAQKIELAGQHHEVTIGRLQRVPIILAEVPDRAVAGRQALQQPHHLHIATRLALKTARGPYLIQVAVKVELQKIARIIGRLARPAVSRRCAGNRAQQGRASDT